MKNIAIDKTKIALSEIFDQSSLDTLFGGGNMEDVFNTFDAMYKDAFVYGTAIGYTDNNGEGNYNSLTLSDRHHIDLLYNLLSGLNALYEKYGMSHFDDNGKIDKSDADAIFKLYSNVMGYGTAIDYIEVVDDMICTTIIFKNIRLDSTPGEKEITMFYNCKMIKTLVNGLFEKMAHRKAA